MQHKAVPTRNIVAAVIGNALEWYDFLVFAFMTPIIAKLFFPTDPSVPGSELNAILMTTAIFGVGFFREWYHERMLGEIRVDAESTPEQRRRRKVVRRSHFTTILAAWVITVPAAALLSAGLFWVFTSIWG